MDFDGCPFSVEGDAVSDAEAANWAQDRREEESESIMALKLQLALKDKELAILDKQLEIDRNRSTCKINQELRVML